MIKTNKKILFITSSLNMGGIERVLATCVNELSQKYSIFVFCLERNEPFYDLNRNVTVLYAPRLFAFTLKLGRLLHNGFKKYLNINFKLSLWSNVLRNKIDKNYFDTMVYLPSSFFMFPSLIKDKKNTKNIIWTHNNHKVYIEDYYKYLKNELIESFEICDAVVALTEEDKDGFFSYSNTNNVVKINNPLTIVNKGLNSDLKNKIISITCRYSINHKGLDFLTQIAKNIPDDWKIAIAGTGSKKEVKEFKRLITSYNISSKIILRGAISGEELDNHYRESSIYIMTSRWEGFGLVLTEAMSFGLPIISFDNSGANEVLDNGKYGLLVEQGNVENFSKELNRMISSYELRKEYSQKSLERIIDFDIEHIIKQWDDIL